MAVPCRRVGAGFSSELAPFVGKMPAAQVTFAPEILAGFSQDADIEVLRGDIPPVAQTPLDQYKAEWMAWRCE